MIYQVVHSPTLLLKLFVENSWHFLLAGEFTIIALPGISSFCVREEGMSVVNTMGVFKRIKKTQSMCVFSNATCSRLIFQCAFFFQTSACRLLTWMILSRIPWRAELFKLGGRSRKHFGGGTMWWCENRIHVNARRLWWLSSAVDGLRFVVGWRIIWWANNGILSRSARWVDTVMWEVGVGNLKISPCSSSQIHPPNRKKKQRIYHFEKCAQVYNVLEDSLTRAKQLTISSMMQNVWAIKDRKTIV